METLSVSAALCALCALWLRSRVWSVRSVRPGGGFEACLLSDGTQTPTPPRLWRGLMGVEFKLKFPPARKKKKREKRREINQHQAWRCFES